METPKPLSMRKLLAAVRKGQSDPSDEDVGKPSDFLPDHKSQTKGFTNRDLPNTELGQQAAELGAPEFEDLVRDLAKIARGVNVDNDHDPAWMQAAALLDQAAEAIEGRMGN